MLPPPGRWALGVESQALVEGLLQTAQRQGLRTAWLAPDARFLSNLSILENLRLLHDWHDDDTAAFDARLQQALAELRLSPPPWLQQRPSLLRERQLLQAGLLRVLLLRPDVTVVHPASLAQAGPETAAQLVASLAHARLLLLADALPDWPAWPQSEPVVAVEE